MYKRLGSLVSHSYAHFSKLLTQKHFRFIHSETEPTMSATSGLVIPCKGMNTFIFYHAFTFCFFIIISVLFGGYNLLFWPSGFFVHYILGLCMCSIFFFFFGSQKFIFCWLRNVFFSPCFFQCIRIIIGGVDFVHVYLKLPLRGRQGSRWW